MESLDAPSSVLIEALLHIFAAHLPDRQTVDDQSLLALDQ